MSSAGPQLLRVAARARAEHGRQAVDPLQAAVGADIFDTVRRADPVAVASRRSERPMTETPVRTRDAVVSRPGRTTGSNPSSPPARPTTWPACVRRLFRQHLLSSPERAHGTATVSTTRDYRKFGSDALSVVVGRVMTRLGVFASEDGPV